MMGRRGCARSVRSQTAAAFIAWACLVTAFAVRAQEIEPRQYSNVPVGLNFLVSGYSHTHGGLAFDSSLPLTDPQLETNSGVLGFARALDFWGRSGKIDAGVAYTGLSGSANYLTDRVEREVDGFSDPLIRLSVNLYGAPALRSMDFASYKQDLIVGAALQISVPAGQYDETRLINIGTNRWFFRPSIGVSKAAGPWIMEATAAVTFFTDNTEFFNGNRRSQDPLYGMQGHLIRGFRSGMWGAVNATYFWGGSTTINGDARNDLQKNWRVGATFSAPINARQSIKIVATDGVSARTGNSYSQFGIYWQYRWGGGM